MGAYGNVPEKYLEHLIVEKVRDQRACAELLEMVSKGDIAGAVIALSEHHPEAPQEIVEMWSYRGNTAVHLWRFRASESPDASDFVSAISKSIDEDLSIDGRSVVTSKEFSGKSKVLVHRIRVREGRVDLLFKVRSRHSYTGLNGRVTDEQVRLVTAYLDMSGPKHLFVVFASSVPSTMCVKHLSDLTLRGWGAARAARFSKSVPPFEAIDFNHQNMVSVAAKIGPGKATGWDGRDSLGKQGGFKMIGHMGAERRDPLDDTDTRLQEQRLEHSHEMSFGVDCKHPNGYDEAAEILFLVRGRHPHIVLLRRASDLAVAKVVNAIAKERAHR